MRVLSLFSGCGGLDAGFAQSDFDIVMANDFGKYACQTYKQFGNAVTVNVARAVAGQVKKELMRLEEWYE